MGLDMGGKRWRVGLTRGWVVLVLCAVEKGCVVEMVVVAMV